MFVNHNVLAVDAQRNLAASGVALGKSVERLSSGLRINRAADDAAGLSISEKLRSQIRGLDQAQRNSQDGISMIQTAEGAMNEVHDMLQRMRELSLQAANDTLSGSDRGAINTELQQLKDEITSVSGRAKFNGKALLTGALSTTQDTGTSTVQAGDAVGNAAVTNIDVSGAKAGESYTIANNAGVLTLTRASDSVQQDVDISGISVAAGGSQVIDFSALGVKITISGGTAGETGANVAGALDTLQVDTAAGAGAANIQVGAQATDTLSVSFGRVDINSGSLDIDTTLTAFAGAYNGNGAVTAAQNLTSALDSAIQFLSTTRANLGASQNRLEHAINNIAVASENTTAAESRIRDADMAKEMATFSRNQILNQAGTAILAQANQVPQGILSLLK
jgi:flagellin